MTHELEKHLIDIGVLPANTLDELEDLVEPSVTEREFHFIDPRDPITGEVPF